MLEIKPVGQNVFVEVIEQEEKTENGLIVVQGKRPRKIKHCKVLAKGKGIYVGGILQPMDIEVGQIVIIPELALKTVEVQGEKLFQTRYIDIEAVITEE